MYPPNTLTTETNGAQSFPEFYDDIAYETHPISFESLYPMVLNAREQDQALGHPRNLITAPKIHLLPATLHTRHSTVPYNGGRNEGSAHFSFAGQNLVQATDTPIQTHSIGEGTFAQATVSWKV